MPKQFSDGGGMLKIYLRRAWVAGILALAASFEAQAAACTSLSSGIWNAAARWNCGHVPTTATGDSVLIASGHAITVDIANAGGVSLDISAGAATSSITVNTGQTLTISGGVTIAPASLTGGNNKTLAVGAGTLTVGGSVTLTGISATKLANLTISTGVANIAGTLTPSNASSQVLFSGAGDLNIGGNFSNGGTFTASTGTVTYNGAGAQNIGTYTYNNLTVNKSAGSATLTGITPVAGNLNVTAGTLDLATFTANRSAAGGTSTVANGATLRIGGTNTYPTNYTTNTLGATSTVDYYGGNQSVAILAYGHLTLSTGSTKTAAGALTVNGNVTIAAIVTFAAGTFTHNVAGNFTNNGTLTPGTGTFNFNATTAGQTISGSATTFNNVIIANTHAAGVTASVALTMAAFTINAASTFNAGAVSHNVSRDFTNNGTFNASTGTIVFNGTVGQALNGATTFYQLSMNNTAAAGVTLAANATVGNALAFLGTNTAKLNTGANKVSISATGTVSGASATAGWVNGKLERNFTTPSAFTFDVGDATSYAPVAVTFTSLAVGGNLTAFTTPGAHPQLASSRIDSGGNFVNRYWTLQSAAISGTYNATFTWAAADVNGTSANYIVQRYVSPTWFNTTLSATNPASISVSGLSALGDFAVGDPIIVGFLREREVIFVQEIFN